MDNENLGARVGIFYVLAHNAVGCALLDVVGTHRQHAVAFVDYEDIVIFIYQLDART